MLIEYVSLTAAAATVELEAFMNSEHAGSLRERWLRHTQLEMFHENAIIFIDGYWLHIMQSNAVKQCVEQLSSFIEPFFNYFQTNFSDDAKFSTF